MQKAGGGGAHTPDGALQHLEQLEQLIKTVEARRAASCDLSDGSPTPASPHPLTPTSIPSRNANFWREVSPQLSYIDGGSSCGASCGRSVSWNLSDLPGNECGPRAPRSDYRASSDSLKLHQNGTPPLPPLTPITKSASDTLCSPSHQPAAHSVVEVEKGDIKTKIQKRLSFGDTLDLHTNIYTPAEECMATSLELAGAEGTANGSSTSLERRWTEEDATGGPPLVRRNSVDAQSQYSFYMDRDLRYYFQHPWLRLIIAYLVIFCNFLLFAEDPVSHSHAESNIPVVGNVFSFVSTKYPDEWFWRMIKVIMWLIAILCGMLVGKVLIHGLIFKKILRLKMFRDEQGSWMTMFLTVIVSLYMFSYVYNLILFVGHEKYCRWQIGSDMDVTNESMMKAAATCTWLGDLVTALMVTDMMLQDNLYPNWAPEFRRLYRISNVPRILIFWCGYIVVAIVVIFLIVSDYISWDELNKGFVETTELSRAFLASFILVMDLLIVMQDWDFPHFTSTIDVNLPGFSTYILRWKYAKISVTGKWFNYGIIFMVMILDLNMWKNQLFYSPGPYGQYIDPNSSKVYTVEDPVFISEGNESMWTWKARSEIDNATGRPYLEADMDMNSRYMDYSLSVKCTAFIPNILGFIMLFTLVSLYGRFPPNQLHLMARPHPRKTRNP
ncbi:transmembrane protein 117-like isoform X2 [Portunus trituberculatus]|uniref:transmembrane protein 117-like isoform X2 n=1 Tax=Portunus trituberculatus TaxID=210409 RepID=UPI001E1CEBFF|nr:transmembrane protein 117-like isoform X2 [Portunus trituberculatus]